MLFPFIISGAVLTAVLCAYKQIWIYSPLIFAGFFVLSVVAYFLFLFLHILFVKKDETPENPSAYYRALFDFSCRLLLKLLNVRVEVSGKEKIEKGKRYLYVENHISAFDPIITAACLEKTEIAFISKPENFKIPLASSFMTKLCFMSIDRENDRKALKTILQAIDFLKKDKGSIGIYPEGTRNKSGDGLLEFHNGVFKIAQKAGVGIVVLTVKDAEKISKRTPFKVSRVKLNVCEVLNSEYVSSHKTAEISERVREIMTESLSEI